MLRFVIPGLALLTMLLSTSCASNSPATATMKEMHPCPAWDLSIPCGRTPQGNYYRISQ